MLPVYVRNFSVIKAELHARVMSDDDLEGERDTALLYMVLGGLVLRLACLTLLGLQKYSEGGSPLAQCLFVTRRFIFRVTGLQMRFVKYVHIHSGAAYDPDAAEEDTFDEDPELDQLRTRRSGMAATVSWVAGREPLLLNSARNENRDATSARF